jgi:hypothetical protein
VVGSLLPQPPGLAHWFACSDACVTSSPTEAKSRIGGRSYRSKVMPLPLASRAAQSIQSVQAGGEASTPEFTIAAFLFGVPGWLEK